MLEPNQTIYPEQPVAVGDEWKGNVELVKKDLEITGPTDTGAMTMKLQAIKDLNGRATAEVAVLSEATKDMGGVSRKTLGKSTVLIDVKTGHVMKYDLKGTLSIAGTANGRGQNGQPWPVRWSGEGTVAMSLVSEPAGPMAASNDGQQTIGGVPNPLSQVQPLPTPPAGAPAAGGAAQTVRYEMYTLMDDPTYIGGPVSHFLIPAGWKVDGSVHWDMASTFPAQLQLHIFDPKGTAAIDVHPALLYHWQTDRNNPIGYHPPVGSKYAGGIVRQPVDDVFTAMMEVVIPAYRKELLNARIVEKEKLPKLAKYVFDHSFGLPGQMQTVRAGRMRFEYLVNGQPVEEDVIAALTLKPQPQFKTVNWSVDSIISTRGPKGTLDDIKMSRVVMEQSTRQNILWFNKLYQFAEAKNKAKLTEIQATAERSRIFAQMTNEVNATRKQMFEDHMRDITERGVAFSQKMREVTPYTTPQGPPVELPSAYGHAWQGTNGQIIMTNEPNYNPNSDPNNTHTGWTELQQAK